MLKEVEQLLVLQDRDKKIRTLKTELKNAPLERKSLEEKLGATQGALETAKKRAQEIEIERKKLENEVLSKREQIAKYQTHKTQTRKNDEFQAMNTAIEHLERDIRDLEDKEMVLMESNEEVQPQIAQANEAAQATKTLVTRQQADLDGKVAAIQQQLAGLETERGTLAETVEEDLLDQYQRLFQNKGLAVVALEHENCTGCHMKVTASTIARTKAGKAVVSCEQCGRILYWNAL